MTYLPHVKRFTAALLLGAVALLTVGFESVERDVIEAELTAVLAKAAFLDASVERLPRKCKQENTAFGNGERVVYKLYYNLNFIWIPAGEVTFTVEDRGHEYKLTAIGETYASYEWFFKVRDRYESYIDKETLLPRKAVRIIHEGNYDLYEYIEFDQATRSGITYRGHTHEEAMAQSKPFASETCLHDVLSSIYYMRNSQLDEVRPNSTIPLSVIMSHEIYPLDVRLIGKEEEKKIKGLGRFDAYELVPQLVAGDVFNEDSEMRVWASTTGNHVPLTIESPVSVGSVKAVLKSHERLRHPLVER